MTSKSDPASSHRVFVGGISWKADEQSLANFFSSFGKVTECKIIMDKVTGKSKGYGFVTFETIESATKVKQSNNLYFLGKTMNVGDAMRKSDSNERIDIRGERGDRSPSYNPYYSQQNYYQQQQQFYQPPPGYIPYAQPPPYVNFVPGSPQGFYVGQAPPFVNYVPGSPTHAMAVDSNNYQPVWQPIPQPASLQQLSHSGGAPGSPSHSHSPLAGSPTIHYQPVVIAPYQPPLQYQSIPPQSPGSSSPHATSAPTPIPGLSQSHVVTSSPPVARHQQQQQQLRESGSGATPTNAPSSASPSAAGASSSTTAPSPTTSPRSGSIPASLSSSESAATPATLTSTSTSDASKGSSIGNEALSPRNLGSTNAQ